MAFCAPTTNSCKRLVPGFEALVNLAYSARNRSACIRIPMVSKKPKLKLIEFRPPDPSCNPYLTFSALLMAGLDGIEKQIDPGEPLEKDIYELPPEEAAKVSQVPGSLEAVLDALEEDHELLLKGNVFTRDLIETWIYQKRTMEVDPMRPPAPPLRVPTLLRRVSTDDHQKPGGEQIRPPHGQGAGCKVHPAVVQRYPGGPEGFRHHRR
jgi:glutamine synthetase